MRTAGYCCYPVDDRQILAQDRFTERIDQGERLFSFTLSGLSRESQLQNVELESQLIHQKSMSVCYFP